MPTPAHLTGAITVLAASALVAAPAAHAVDQPARSGGRAERSTPPPASSLAVADLDDDVVARYGWHVRLGADGHFVIRLPDGLERQDVLGAAAARAAVASTNMLIDAQRTELARRGGAAPAPGRLSPVTLSAGRHAALHADWWGLTLTLDPTATRWVTEALAEDVDVDGLIAVLRRAGIVVALEADGVARVVLAGVLTARDAVASKTSGDGLVVKCLWSLVPWFERPTCPFQQTVPASVVGGRGPVATTRPAATALPRALSAGPPGMLAG